MVVRLNDIQLVVFLVLLAARLSLQRIVPHLDHQLGNEVAIYSPLVVDPDFCRTVPGLRRQQIDLCYQQPDTTLMALEGLNQAVKECQSQFAGHRWNCSSLSTKGKNPYVSAILKKGYKETAFAYAISSAGVVISVARACSSSSLLGNCGCGQKIYKTKKFRKEMKENLPYSNSNQQFIPNEITKNSPALAGNYFQQNLYASYAEDSLNKEKPASWKWNGCSDNLKYGLRFSKLFLDTRAHDIHSKTNLHNNQAGRMIVKQQMVIHCKCHGMSGSCMTKTCWRSTPTLKVVGRILMEKYSSATLVDDTNMGDEARNSRKNSKLANPRRDTKKKLYEIHKFPSSQKKKKKNSSAELQYFEKSPHYCDEIPSLEVAGTTGRYCNSTIKTGPSSCTNLCCGRGYNLIRHAKIERCHCKFIYCCEVKCDICNTTDYISVCK